MITGLDHVSPPSVDVFVRKYPPPSRAFSTRCRARKTPGAVSTTAGSQKQTSPASPCAITTGSSQVRPLSEDRHSTEFHPGLLKS